MIKEQKVHYNGFDVGSVRASLKFYISLFSGQKSLMNIQLKRAQIC